MEKFKHVVGIIHTNYLSYLRSNTFGQLTEPIVYYLNQGTATGGRMVQYICGLLYSYLRICSGVSRVLPQDHQTVECAARVRGRERDHVQRPW